MFKLMSCLVVSTLLAEERVRTEERVAEAAAIAVSTTSAIAHRLVAENARLGIRFLQENRTFQCHLRTEFRTALTTRVSLTS